MTEKSGLVYLLYSYKYSSP